jgi:hypothetical protein
VTNDRIPIDKLLESIPTAIWSPGRPIPYVYRGSPLEMVEQMASEMGPAVTPAQAMDKLMKVLATSGRLHIQIHGSPPEEIRAGIFVHCLLQQRICRPMAQA